ncbi:MAG: LysR family transcriptional regulator [Peptococcaceae bacterium]|nr:LysR family transcriptional regulator [Peptococcaceae bacterium]MBO5429471.1 LysR family transcriptional regulator [Peptococcaceae bacterium]
MLRLEQLNYLRMVVRFNSIKLAAESLNVVPSTISTALHKMEDEIGVPLLVRTYRGIEVTEVAREIAVKAEEIQFGIREIEEIINKYNSTVQTASENDNYFQVFCSRGYYQCQLEDILDKCDAIGLSVDCPDFSRGNEVYLEIVNQNKDAILINYFAEPFNDTIELYENVSYIRLYTSKPYILFNSKYNFVSMDKSEISLEEALQLPYLMFTEGYDRALPIFEMLEQAGELKVVGKYSNVTVLSTMLARGKGVGVTTWLPNLNGAIVNGGKMRMVPIRCNMRISLLVCYNNNISKEKRKMLDLLIPIFYEQ